MNITSKLDNELSAMQSGLIRLMKQKFDGIAETETQKFSLIHGELAPPHVFILENGEIGLIDIEGIIFFDIEYNWAVINFIYGDAIPLPKSVNTGKFEFYKLCWKIGHVSAAVDYLVHADSNDK